MSAQVKIEMSDAAGNRVCVFITGRENEYTSGIAKEAERLAVSALAELKKGGVPRE